MGAKHPNGSVAGAVVKPWSPSWGSAGGPEPGASDGANLADRLISLYQTFPRAGTLWFDGTHWAYTTTPERAVFGLAGLQYVLQADDGRLRVFYVWRRGNL